MATKSAVNQEKSLNDWKTVFPDFTTLEGSCLFIKKLIAVSLSAITYIRGIFPERAYGNKDLCGLKLKILNEDCGLKSVKKFIDLIRNCYDAVEKKYLEQISIGVVADPKNRNEVIEVYNLLFQYKDNECSITCNSEKSNFSSKHDPTIQATLLMLKSVCTMSDLLGKLPDNSYITMKLLYYDDVTPPDYEPLGFLPCYKEKFEFVGETMKLMLGKIGTDNHSYKFLLKTTLGKNIRPHHHTENSLTASQSTYEDNVVPNENELEENVFEESETLEERKKKKIEKAVSGEETEYVLQCPCNCKTGDLSDIIICVSCGKRQHKVCYAIFETIDIPSVFYCVDCFLDNTDESSNLDLIYTYQEDHRQNLCTMRRALRLCTVLETIGSSILEKKLGCNKMVANKLIRNLEFEGFIKKSGRNKYTVNASNIRSYGFETYFPSKENVDVYQHGNSQHEVIDVDKNIEDEFEMNKYRSNYHSEELSETDVIENSIYQVQSLSLDSSLREGMTNRMSQENKTAQVKSESVTRKSNKRKLSNALLSPDNSEELFQSSSFKKRRSRYGKS